MQRGQCLGAADSELLRLRGQQAARARQGHGVDGDDCSDGDETAMGRLHSLTPNLKLVIRDATHASRRVTAKPEAADTRLDELTRRLFTDKHSITQIIQHSEVWRREFHCFIELQENQSGGRVSNVRAALHRHESKAKPRGRFVLNFDAFIQTALLIVADRVGEVRKSAISFLQNTTVEDVLLVSMLADAADEALVFTRQLDDENMDPAQLPAHVKRFLQTIQLLFVERQCLELPGFTSHMIEGLKRPRVFQPSPTLPARTFGGPDAVTRGMIDRCLAHMQKYVRLATAVTRAEFPQFEVMSAFKVFHLEVPQLRLRDAKAALARGHLSSAHRRDLLRLATFFKKDAAKVEGQFLAYRPAAMAHKSITNCDNGSAWRHAIDVISRRYHCGLEQHPARDFIDIAMRYFCFSCSTAGVEQNFSSLKRLFGEHALTSADAHEEQIVRVLLNPADEQGDLEILQRSQAPFSRKHIE